MAVLHYCPQNIFVMGLILKMLENTSLLEILLKSCINTLSIQSSVFVCLSFFAEVTY